jgi:phosphoglycolate phosphatase-like HAD superfamily hydrolase
MQLLRPPGEQHQRVISAINALFIGDSRKDHQTGRNTAAIHQLTGSGQYAGI